MGNVLTRWGGLKGIDMRICSVAIMFTVLCCSINMLADNNPVQLGAFRVVFDPDNSQLPASIQWQIDGNAVELLAENVGLNLSFTDFEFRNKFYREENKHVWGNRPDPRFTVEPRNAVAKETTSDNIPGVNGFAVQYECSFAQVDRQLVTTTELPSQLTIQYVVTFTREVMVHEGDMFSVGIRFAPSFETQIVPDARGNKLELLKSAKLRNPRYVARLPWSGPKMFVDAEHGAAVACTAHVLSDRSGELSSVRLLKFAKDETLTIQLTLSCSRNLAADEEHRLLTGLDDLTDPQRASLLYDVSSALVAEGKRKEAESVLLRAAALSPDWAAPYGTLAGLRRDTKTGGSGQTDAWVEAAYRMPYNYGYILSGSGITGDQRLSEAERRLAVFNMLVAVENTVFYPDYYIWAARPFETRGMLVQTCAMYRQALWALQYLPRSEPYREKYRKRFTEKIAELEKKLLEQTSPELPPLTVVRPAVVKDAQPGQ